MNEPLRPSSLGEILDRTAHIYRSKFWVFFGIAGLPAGVILTCAAAVFLYFAWLGSGGAAAMGPAATGLLTLLLLGVGGLVMVPLCTAVMALGWAASTHAASRVLMGEAVTIRGTFRAAWSRGWQYLWLLVLEMLVLVAAPLAAWAMVVAILGILAAIAQTTGGLDATTPLGGATILVFLVLGGYSLWMLLRICLAFPASVVEGLGAWSALKRAVSLSKGLRLRILLLFVLGTVLGWMLAGLLTIPVIVVLSLIPGWNSPQHSQMAGTVFLFTYYAAGFAVQALTRPVYAIALVGFYYDGRVRQEGFDIELLMRKAGMIVEPAATEAAMPWTGAIPARAAVAPVVDGGSDINLSADVAAAEPSAAVGAGSEGERL